MVFGFLKDKLKKVAEAFTKATTKVEELPEPKEEQKTKPIKETKPAKPTKPEPKKTELKKPESKKEKPSPAKPTAKPSATPAAAPVPAQSAADLLSESEEIEEEAEEIEEELGIEQPKPVHTPLKSTPTKAPEHTPILKVEQNEEKRGFFSRLKAVVTTKQITRDEFETLFQEFEIDLLENNVALDVVDKIREDLWIGLSTERFSRMKPEERVAQALKQSLSELFLEPFDILAAAKKESLYIICAVGVNGSGKTTTLAKLGKYFTDHKLPVVFAAGDTFRAAAIQQLEEHAKRLNLPIIKQQYGADPAAVAFDAIAYAKANKARVVLIDTAGRLHSNTNLMAELQKVVRVAKPHATIFIGEATTGNDCIEQAIEFQKAVAIDGIVLSKVDVDERGGAALSISYVTRKPILFFGTGQRYEDIEPFDKKKVLESLEF